MAAGGVFRLSGQHTDLQVADDFCTCLHATVGSPASCTFDSGLTQSIGNMVKVFGWYDNEWGYSNRLVELVALMGKKSPAKKSVAKKSVAKKSAAKK